MSKPWEKDNVRRKPERKIQRHLIVCEDAKSAADYLRCFKVPKEFAEVVVEGGAGNTASVVEEALKLRKAAAKSRITYAKIWCVFDRDPVAGTKVRQDVAIAKNFHRAFDLARENPEVEIIWANECFELWYLLHFAYQNTPIAREKIYERLAQPDPNGLGKKYYKSDTAVFDALKGKRREKAKKNAKRLLDSYFGEVKPADDNPSTNIHELVVVLEQLQELREEEEVVEHVEEKVAGAKDAQDA